MRTVHRRGANHGLHLFLTIVTMGMWAPVWLVVAVIGRREVTTVQEDLNQAWIRAYQQAPYPQPLHGAVQRTAQQVWAQSHNAHQVAEMHLSPMDSGWDPPGGQWNPYSGRWEHRQ